MSERDSADALQTGQGNEVQRISWEERRLGVANRLGGIAELMAEAIERRLVKMVMSEEGDLSDAKGIRDLATALGICIEKAQLLTGGKTGQLGIELRYEVQLPDGV